MRFQCAGHIRRMAPERTAHCAMIRHQLILGEEEAGQEVRFIEIISSANIDIINNSRWYFDFQYTQ